MFLVKYKKYWLSGLILIFLTIVAFGVVYLVKRPVQKTKISAAAGTATVRMQPQNVTLPQQKVVQVWATVNKPVGFIDLDITFDKSKLTITKEPAFSVNSTNTVSLTDMATANTSGRITFVAGVDPTKVSTAPNGTFQIGTIEFTNKSGFTSGTTTIGIQTNESQFVDMDATPFTVSGINTTVAFATLSTPTSTSTSTATPRTSANIPTPTPTSNPTRSASPIPTPTSTGYPAWDVNRDGLVNMIDIGIVIDNYNSVSPTTTRADVNNNGTIDIVDIGIIVDNYE